MVLVLLFAAATLGEVYINHKWQPKVDFRAYRATALTAGQSGDIYDYHRSGDHHLRTTPYTYPPLFACLIYPLAKLPLAFGYYLWCGLMLVSLGGAVVLIKRTIQVLGVQRSGLLAVAPLLLCPFILDSNLYWGQVNVLVMTLVAGVVLMEVRGRSLAAGSLLAVAAALKVLPALILLWFLARRDTRALAGFAATAVLVLLGIPALVGGPGWAWEMNVAWVEILLGIVTDGRSALQSYYNGLSNGSLVATFDRLFGGSGNKALLVSISQKRIDSIVNLIRMALVMASIVAVTRASLLRRRALMPQLFALAVAMLLVCGWLINYLLWDHHLVGLILVLPLLAAVVMDRRLSARWRQPLVVCLVAGVLAMTSGFYAGSRRWGLQALCLLVLWGGTFWALIGADRALVDEHSPGSQLLLPLRRW
ncbi:MAG: glycosyltransferase family 87 protein [bacterium]